MEQALRVNPLLPKIPRGSSGLIYVISSQNALSGEAFAEVFERRDPEAYLVVDGEEFRPEWAELVPVSPDRNMVRKLEDPLDQQIVTLLARVPRSRENPRAKPAAKTRGKASKPARPAQIRAERATDAGESYAAPITDDVWRRLLPLLIESERCYVEPRFGGEAALLEREDFEPYDFELAIDFGARGGEFQLTGRFMRNGRPIPSEGQVLLVVEGEMGHLVRASGRVSAVDFDGSAAWIKALRRGRFQRVPRRSLTKLYKVFERSTTLPGIHAPAVLGIEMIRGVRPQPELKLDSGPQEAIGEVSFRYNDDSVRAARPGRCFFSSKTNHLVARNLDLESAHAVRLLDLGFTYDHATHRFHIQSDKLPNAAPELFELGWMITGKGIPFRPPTDMQVEIESNDDYIELSVTVHFEDQQVGLPALLEALQEGSRMIPLGRGIIGVLPFVWLEKNAAWMALGEVYGDRLRFRRQQSSVVDALLNDNMKTKLDAGFKAERERLEHFQGIDAAEPSKNFVGSLRAYQKMGVGWLRFLDQMAWGGCLADDMGLGKTIQTLAFLQLLKEQEREGPVLIVAPKSLTFNWLREAARFTPELKTFAYIGQKRAKSFDNLDDFDLVVTTYGTIRRDIAKLSKRKFLYVILDEGQAIKNPESQNAKAAMLLDAERRLVLSGTPVENHLGELWSIFNFLNPGMLGSLDSFKKRFGDGRDLSPANLRYLRRSLGPFMLRRKKEEVATDLPAKIEETIICEMEPEQKKLYREVRDRAKSAVLNSVATRGVSRSKLHILEALLRLRQAACHPALIDEKHEALPSGKFQVLLSMLSEVEAEGHKVLIFSQFTSLLAILRREMDEAGHVYEYLDGQTSNRQDRVDKFQNDPNIRSFLISLKAGGVGLNLTAADYVFILDPWWNPAVEAQAIDRAHRIGQDKTVFAYRFVSEATIEERIAELQESKRKLADAIVRGSEGFLRDLTSDQLEFLLD